MEDSTIIQIISVIFGIAISGSYPVFGMYLKNQGRKFDILFEKTDKLEKLLPGIEKDICWIKKEINRLRDKQGE